MDDHPQCIRVTPALANDMANIAEIWTSRLSAAISRLRNVTNTENSHDPVEEFLAAVRGPYDFVNDMGPMIAIAKLTGAIIGKSDDVEDMNRMGYFDIENPKPADPLPESLKNLLQNDATDFPQAEA